MPELILVMMLLPLVGCLFVLSAPDNKTNAYSVAFFTLITNLIVILRLFSLLDINSSALSFGFEYQWLENYKLNLYFGVDAFSLLLVIAAMLKKSKFCIDFLCIILLEFYFYWPPL